MRFSTLDQWLSWQETLHPSEIDLGLDRVSQVLSQLELDHPDFTVVTVAGTNGKGSSVAMLQSILMECGLRVGAYTSPHLLRYNERIKINGQPVDDKALCESFERVDQARSEVSLTYFEFGTLAAIDILQRAGVEIAVLEVGLGGRLDAVNVLDADVALITAIDVDHENWLGNDRESIAREKAGIMRTGRPAICSDNNIPASLIAYAQELGAELHLLGRDFDIKPRQTSWEWKGMNQKYSDLPYPSLTGDFQLNNAAGVVAVLKLLKKQVPVLSAMSEQELSRGLVNVQLPGRFQVIQGTPLQILDVAHNPQAAWELAKNLSRLPIEGKTRAVMAMLADKNIVGVVDQLTDEVDIWYLAPLNVPRAATLDQLESALSGQVIKRFENPEKAYQAAKADSEEKDRIVVFGSFYTVAATLSQAV